MNPADQRVSELVDKWLTSLELHLKYASLSDEAYWQVQPWVRHQRPARWILDLATTRARELKRQLEARIGDGDSGFAEALELMGFLANLVGVQNIERFIPLAERERENAEVAGPGASSRSAGPPPLSATSTQTRALIEPTREMRIPIAPTPPPAAAPAVPAAASVPAPPAPKPAPPAPKPPPAVAAPAPAAAAPTPAARPAPRRDARGAGAKQPKLPPAGSTESQIIADAVRLLKWGREWHELAEAIARIADRPGVVEVRKCLRTYKSEIERSAAQ